VAIPAPLSGTRAAVGLSVHTAAGIMATEINAAGGINGQRLSLTLLDDPCSSSAGLLLAREIAAGPAVAIIGHPCAPSAQVAAGIYAAAGKLFVAAGPAAPVLFAARPGPHVFRLPAPEPHGEALAKLVVRTVQANGGGRVAIVRDKTQLNIGLAAPIDAALRAAGIAPLTDTFTGGDKDFTAFAQRLAAAKITHVALLAFTIEGALAAADITRAIPSVEIIGPDQLATPDFGSLAGSAAAARVRVLLPATADSYGQRFPAAKLLADRMTAIGVTPTREALETAAALQAWAAAARGEGGVAHTATRLTQPSNTILGPTAFDARGHAVMPFWTVHRWRDGTFHPD
jgi:branched-chain amino acid transport system substrate-binding protein